jgi:hypothetical protein
LAKQYWICRLTNKGVSQLRSELFQIRRQWKSITSFNLVQ